MKVGCFVALVLVSLGIRGQVSVDFQVKGLEGQAYVLGIYGEQHFRVDSVFLQANQPVTWERDSVVPQGLYYLLLPEKRDSYSFSAVKIRNFRCVPP